MRLGGNP